MQYHFIPDTYFHFLINITAYFNTVLFQPSIFRGLSFKEIRPRLCFLKCHSYSYFDRLFAHPYFPHTKAKIFLNAISMKNTEL